MKKLVLVGLASVILVSCAAPATLNFTPNNIEPVTVSKKIKAELKNINVSTATKEEQKGELQVGFFGNEYEQSFKTTFKDALDEAITRSAIFTDESKNKLSLSAKVLQFETPGAGVNFNTKMLVRYDFIDRQSGKSKYMTEIHSSGSVPFDYAFSGAIRSTEARNRAVKSNIEKLLTNLQQNNFIK